MYVRIAMLLVLLLFLTSTASAAVFLYPSTSSAVVNVCDGTNVTLTCVTDTGTLIWSTATGRKTFKSGFMENSSSDVLGDYFIVRLTNETNMTLTSDLTIVAPSPSLHETMILCRDDGFPVSAVIEKTLLLNAVFAPVKLRYTAMNFTSAVLAWATSAGSCVHYYTVHIHNHICELVDNTTTADTILNVSGLTHGVEYTVTVYGVYYDEVGVSATIFMNLDVPEIVAELAVDSSLDSNKAVSLRVSWKHPSSSQARPPVVSYIVQHNVTDNSSGLLEELTKWTNITIHGALPGHVYYIQVTPVNVLGSGQSVRYVVGLLGVPMDTTANPMNTTMDTTANPMNTTANPMDATANPMNTTTCSCAVELGVTIPLCALLLVVGCCISVYVTVKSLHKKISKKKSS